MNQPRLCGRSGSRNQGRVFGRDRRGSQAGHFGWSASLVSGQCSLRKRSHNPNPLLGADGTPVELRVLADDSGFVLTGDGGTSAGNFAPMPGEARAGQVGWLFTALDVSVESEVLVCRARDASQLAQTIVRLAQAIACLSLMSDDN